MQGERGERGRKRERGRVRERREGGMERGREDALANEQNIDFRGIDFIEEGERINAHVGRVDSAVQLKRRAHSNAHVEQQLRYPLYAHALERHAPTPTHTHIYIYVNILYIHTYILYIHIYILYSTVHHT